MPSFVACSWTLRRDMTSTSIIRDCSLSKFHIIIYNNELEQVELKKINVRLFENDKFSSLFFKDYQHFLNQTLTLDLKHVDTRQVFATILCKNLNSKIPPNDDFAKQPFQIIGPNITLEIFNIQQGFPFCNYTADYNITGTFKRYLFFLQDLMMMA
uniref:Uncharacterized protein n=1 Tax=Drosophila-associated filamentous virus TaxID=2743186 RepID=A0A6M9U0K8_9VIRU|nr:putative protein 17 [Drosophila-associated filamentous virus]